MSERARVQSGDADVRAWLDAASRTEVDHALHDVYALMARETESRRPRCDASGRCCNFEQWGHRLYVTGLEAAWFLCAARSDAPATGMNITPPPSLPGRGPGGGSGENSCGAADHHRTPHDSHHTLASSHGAESGQGASCCSVEAIDRALAAGTCPFLTARLCSVHGIRPMGCRAYFCDETAQDWQKALFERCHRMIAALHDRLGVPYVFGEWRAVLKRIIEATPQLGASIIVPGDAPSPTLIQVGRS